MSRPCRDTRESITRVSFSLHFGQCIFDLCNLYSSRWVLEVNDLSLPPCTELLLQAEEIFEELKPVFGRERLGVELNTPDRKLGVA